MNSLLHNQGHIRANINRIVVRLIWVIAVVLACILLVSMVQPGGALAQGKPPIKPLVEQTTTISANNWTNLFPDLYAVSAVSSSEAWAVGEYGHMLHLVTGSWVVVD